MPRNPIPILRTDFEAWLLELCPVYEVVMEDRYCVPLSKEIGLEITTPLSDDGAPPVGKDTRCRMMFVLRRDYSKMNPQRFPKMVATRSPTWQQEWAKQFDVAYRQFLQDETDLHRRLQDPEEYRKEWIAKIENVGAWRKFEILADLHDQLSFGEWLSTKQENAILKFQPKKKLAPPNKPKAAQGTASKTAPPSPPPAPLPISPTLIAAVERLHVAAVAKGDTWIIDFTKGITKRLKDGRPLTPRQDMVLQKNLTKYGLSLATAVA
jgi:hypothetical protein